MKKILHMLHNAVLDAIDWFRRYRADKLYLPPRRLRDIGSDDLKNFEVTGLEFLDYFKELCGLHPDAKVLEVGCGSGRIALPLTSYLSVKGAYSGVEVVAPSVQWCTRKITGRYPNFTFIHADLYNKRYNPSSVILAKEYRFPFKDSSFDFVYLTSVFTHLLVEDTEQYLREIFRVLRPKGKVLMTFFLLNEEQRCLADRGVNQIHFLDMNSFFQVRDKEVPESAVAYDEKYLMGLLEDIGFDLAMPVRYGTWSGRQDGMSFQDLIVASPSK